jgi:hypothetical protein
MSHKQRRTGIFRGSGKNCASRLKRPDGMTIKNLSAIARQIANTISGQQRRLSATRHGQGENA